MLAINEAEPEPEPATEESAATMWKHPPTIPKKTEILLTPRKHALTAVILDTPGSDSRTVIGSYGCIILAEKSVGRTPGVHGGVTY